MGKLRDWLRGDGDRPRWSRLQYAVAACAEDLQDELEDEWNDWTPDKFTGDESEDEFDSCSEWDVGARPSTAPGSGSAGRRSTARQTGTVTETRVRTKGHWTILPGADATIPASQTTVGCKT